MPKRTTEPVDEFAETQVLFDANDKPADHEADPLSLYVEYERERDDDSVSTPTRKRR